MPATVTRATAVEPGCAASSRYRRLDHGLRTERIGSIVDRRVERDDRRAPVAVPGDLAVHGPVPRHVHRRHGLLDERDLRADPLGEVRPGAAPGVDRQQRLAPVVQVPGRNPEGRPRRDLICHDPIIGPGL